MGQELILLLLCLDVGLFLIGVLVIGAIRMIQLSAQSSLDKKRTTFILNFPAELAQDRILAWLRATSRVLWSSKYNLGGAQTMTFETISSSMGIIHRLIVPTSKADAIIPQLRALAPGISATPEVVPVDHKWRRAVEIGMTDKMLPLRIPNAMDTSTSILALLQPLKENHAIIVQWVVGEARQMVAPQISEPSGHMSFVTWLTMKNKPDDTKDRQTKLSEPNLMAVLRVAAAAPNDQQARALIDRVRTAFKAVETSQTAFYVLTATQKGIIGRVKAATYLPVWPAQVSVLELTALLGWPLGTPHVSGLPRGASRQLPANLSVPRKGILIGTSTFPSDPRPVAMSFNGGMQHAHIIGGTGVGKSTLLANMAEQDMAAGHTVIVLEAKGDLFYEVLDRVPKSRMDDVIIVDVQDRAFPVGYNVLKQGDPRIAAGNIKNLFEHHFPELQHGSPWARSALHRGLETLATHDRAAFTDIAALFSPSSRSAPETDWKEHIIRNLTDYDLKMFWQRFDNLKAQDQERYAAPLMDRAWIITETPEVRNIFGQTTSSFTFEQVLKENKILLINLSGIAADAAALTGTIFMQGLWTAVQKERGSQKPAYLYLDEFQSFLRLPVAPEEMLAKARSFKLGMRLAHQHLDQLSSYPELKSAVMANARNKVAFQLGSEDSTKMAREFGALVSPNDFQMLRQYEAFARVVTDEGISQPFSLRTLPPSRPTGHAKEILAMSRAKYGRPVDEVIHDMRTRRSSPEVAQKSRRPTISGEDFFE